MYPISVVISTFNDQDFIEQCLRSVVAAGASEVILVSDACTDNTVEIAESLGIVQLKVITLNANSGPSNARNIGIATSSQRYVAIVDGDDIVPSDRFERLIPVLEDTGAFGVMDELVAFDSETNDVLWKKLEDSMSFEGQKIMTIGDLIRYDLGSLKPVFDRAQFQASGVTYPILTRRGEDFLLLLNLLHRKHKLIMSSNTHYMLRRETTGRLTSNRTMLYMEMLKNEVPFYLGHSWSISEHFLFLVRHSRNLVGFLRNAILGR
jgi:succinoglycan biosynthesis protein ExoO